MSRGVSPGGIELHDLAKSYGPIEAVRGIDVSIAPGETVALLGPNGAGKSTTIDMLLGLTRPDRGTVELFGAPPRAAVARGAVGAMLQTGALIRDLSVRELVTMVASLYPKPLGVEETIELTKIGDIRDQRTHKLSGGQTQRVRFAIAIVTNPDLLVLDEPTVALDVESRHAFWTTMREFTSRGKTVLFATHYLEEADDFADRVVLMAAGSVVADGPPGEIKAMVGTRSIRATLPGADADGLADLPGVTRFERRGEAIILACSDSDVAIRALLERFPDARDIEITGAGLEEAFLELTAGVEMTATVYVKYELLRTFRNRRFIFLSLGFPLVLYFLIAAPNRHVTSLGGTGISAPLYFMVGLAAFGGMNAVLAAGARIANERTVGWTRQLRLTPLSTRMYFRTKVLTGYVMALCTLVLLYIAGSTLGVRLSAGHWLHMTGFILIGLIPFAVLGILLGHLLTVDSIGPAIGGITALLSILGGIWFPITNHVMRDLAQALPSYWLVQAAHVGLGGNGWGTRGWLVDIAWTAALGALAVRAYRRDTGRA